MEASQALQYVPYVGFLLSYYEGEKIQSTFKALTSKTADLTPLLKLDRERNERGMVRSIIEMAVMVSLLTVQLFRDNPAVVLLGVSLSLAGALRHHMQLRFIDTRIESILQRGT
jgi:hypothetical protein